MPPHDDAPRCGCQTIWWREKVKLAGARGSVESLSYRAAHVSLARECGRIAIGSDTGF